jgi:hypothetical protein
VDSVDLINGILEFEPKSDFLVEGLIGLLEIFDQDLSLVREVEVFVFEAFQLFVHGKVFLFVEFLVFLDDLLSFLDLSFELLDFPEFIPLNFTNQSFIITRSTILK